MQLDSCRAVGLRRAAPTSELFAATVHMQAPTVGDGDIERVLAAGSHHSVREGRAVLHSLPIGYALDEQRGIRDPRGMLGTPVRRRHARRDRRRRRPRAI